MNEPTEHRPIYAAVTGQPACLCGWKPDVGLVNGSYETAIDRVWLHATEKEMETGRITIQRIGRGAFRASCGRCGWHTTMYSDEEIAVEAAQAHARTTGHLLSGIES